MTLPIALVFVVLIVCVTAMVIVLNRRPQSIPVPAAAFGQQQPIGAPAASARQADELEKRIAALEARVERQDAVIAKSLQEMRGMMEPLREEIVRAQNKQRDARN